MPDTKSTCSSSLLDNLDKLHTTSLGVVRIRRNLSLATDDVAAWCRAAIQSPGVNIIRRGKNWYASTQEWEITVNAHSCTIITAHLKG